MFFRNAQQSAATAQYTAQYIEWIMNRAEGVVRLTSDTKLNPRAETMQMLQQLNADAANMLGNGKPYAIDDRDGTPRLWIDQSSWVQYDVPTESYRFCAMNGNQVSMPFHTTRMNAMTEWLGHYLNSKKAIAQTSSGSKWSYLASTIRITPQAVVTALLAGMLAMAWFLG